MDEKNERPCTILESIKLSCKEIKAMRAGMIPKRSWNDFKQESRYEELKSIIRKLSPTAAERVIKIVEEESNDIERRIAFLDSTIQEISAGADYSKVETIDDMAKVYARSLLDRLGF